MNTSYTTGLQHIGIPTNCLDASINFYLQLGFEISFRRDNVVFMKLHKLLMELYESEEISRKAGAINHIALNVKDIEAVFRHIKSIGITMLDDKINRLPFFEKGVKFFSVEGPNGERIEFNQIVQ